MCKFNKGNEATVSLTQGALSLSLVLFVSAAAALYSDTIWLVYGLRLTYFKLNDRSRPFHLEDSDVLYEASAPERKTVLSTTSIREERFHGKYTRINRFGTLLYFPTRQERKRKRNAVKIVDRAKSCV